MNWFNHLLECFECNIAVFFVFAINFFVVVIVVDMVITFVVVVVVVVDMVISFVVVVTLLQLQM